jgi:hypothetical protein
MDTTTPQGESLFHVFGALAQFERSLIQERFKPASRPLVVVVAVAGGLLLSMPKNLPR